MKAAASEARGEELNFLNPINQRPAHSDDNDTLESDKSLEIFLIIIVSIHQI